MNFKRSEMQEMMTEALENTKTQTTTNNLNAQTINELVSSVKLLNSRISYLEHKCERYRKAYNKIYWDNEERIKNETVAAELERNLKNHFETERTDN